MAFPYPTHVTDLESALNDTATWDAVILIAEKAEDAADERISAVISQHLAINAATANQTSLMAAPELPGGRLIFSPTGSLNRYFDDVRRFADAAQSAAVAARGAGAINPLLLVVHPNKEQLANAVEVSYLAMAQALWQPLEAREYLQEDEIEPMQSVGIVGDIDVRKLGALEAGRRVARDLCGTEPERMAPPKFADYCVGAFKGSKVEVEVISCQETLEKTYPLLFAVGRSAAGVERHHSRVITLTYEPEGEITQSLYLAGKGIVYDTGGADLKVGGHMAGMSRDKGGAASVAGFMKTLSEIEPKGLRVVAELGAVRNSIGSDAFVSDEIIVGRAGKRVRIGNTDAEGRLVLADVLAHLKELAGDDKNAEFYSVATLTGHAARAMGPYTALVENGSARDKRLSQSLSDLGDVWGDPAEVSRSRREDYDFVAPRTKADDLLSSNNAASAVTARGHQFPMAFLSIASGLDESPEQAYVHVDIAGSGVEKGDWQHGKPTAAAVSMLAAKYLL